VLKMADYASDALVSDIIGVVKGIVAKSGLALPNSDERNRIVRQFCELSPASSTVALGDIVNAGWTVRLDWKLWSKFNFTDRARLDILNDLVFKTMEVMEFETKTNAVANAK